MMLLRVTSPDHVHGVTSDDGFTIGAVTLAGTYNLLLLGGAVGIIGAVAYRLVKPWLIGPLWFRRLTVGLAAGAVGGASLLHADGVDFTALRPTWLAVGLFIALPLQFGVLIGSIVDSVARPDSWSARGRRRWVLPIVCVACFPPTVLVLPFAALIIGVGELASGAEFVQRLRRTVSYSLMVRGVWLLIAILGLVALINDIADITARVGRPVGSFVNM